MTYSTEAVSKALHATPRQLQWWDEQGLVQPAHVGHRRDYNEDDLIVVSVVIKLRRAHIAPARCQQVITLLYRHAEEIHRKLAAGAPVYLLTRLTRPSRSVQVLAALHYTHAAAVIDALRWGPVLLVEIGPELQNVRANPGLAAPRPRGPRPAVPSQPRRQRAEA